MFLKSTKISTEELIDYKKKKIMKKGGFSSVWSLYNTYYIRSGFGPFFALVFPVLIYSILGSVMDSKYMFGGVVAMSSMSLGLQGLPWSLMELKNSVILKRIGASPVKTWQFTLAIILHSFLWIIISILWLMLWALIIFRDPSIFSPLSKFAPTMGFIYGNFLAIFMSLAMGFGIASISKNEVQANMIGMILYMPATFLSGQFISIDVIAKSDVMNWLSIITPFRYPTMFIIRSWAFGQLSSSNPFEIADISQSVTLSLSELTKIIDSGTLEYNGTTIDLQAAGINSIDDILSLINKNPNTILGEELKAYNYFNSVYQNGQFYMSNAVIYHSFESILGHIYPITGGVVAASISGKKFKWSSAG